MILTHRLMNDQTFSFVESMYKGLHRLKGPLLPDIEAKISKNCGIELKTLIFLLKKSWLTVVNKETNKMHCMLNENFAGSIKQQHILPESLSSTA